jgi:hypothetical protein
MKHKATGEQHAIVALAEMHGDLKAIVERQHHALSEVFKFFDKHKVPCGDDLLIGPWDAVAQLRGNLTAILACHVADPLRAAARSIVDAMIEVGERTNWADGDETDRVYSWHEIKPLAEALERMPDGKQEA